MEILLDTHIAIWAILDSPSLPQQARELILSPGNDVFVSDASIWEVAVKSVARPDALPCDTVQFLSKCKESGYRFLSISHDAIIAYTGLDYVKAGASHKDPFDRLLVAQAKSTNMMLVTHDKALSVYGEPLVLII